MEEALWQNAIVVLYLLGVTWVVTSDLSRERPPAGASATVSALLSRLAERNGPFGALWERSAPFRTRLGRRLPSWADDLGIAAGLSILLVCLAVSVELLEDVVEEDTAIDARVAEAIGTPLAIPTELAVIVSTATSPRAIAAVAVAVIAFLVWKRRRIEAIGLFLAVGGTGLWVSIIKEVVGRGRPPGVDLYHPHGMAFPSGHTSGTVALYLFLAWLVSRGNTGWAGTWPWLYAVAITVVVGLSRIYLAVHWVTDVLGAVAITTAWVLLCVLWTRGLLARHAGHRYVPVGETSGQPER